MHSAFCVHTQMKRLLKAQEDKINEGFEIGNVDIEETIVTCWANPEPYINCCHSNISHTTCITEGS